MRVVGFQFEHLELFDWRQDEYTMYNTGSDFVKALLTAEKEGDVFTFMHDGRIIAVGGIVRQSLKTGYAFTLFSVHADKAGIAAARTIKRMFSRMIEDMGLHRVVTYNLEHMGKHHKWCEWLGFRRECVVENYDDEGRNYVQYGLVTHGT